MQPGQSDPKLPLYFQTLRRHCASLADDTHWRVNELGDAELEGNLRAAAHVTHGGMLHKFRKSGREKPHRRFVRVVGGTSSLSGRQLQAQLMWDKKSSVIVRADTEVYESCFQGEAAPDGPGCFQVILDKRMLFLVADTEEEKEVWVRGINAVVAQGIGQLQRDDERLGAEVATEESGDWVAVVDQATGCVYVRNYGSAVLDEYWIQSNRIEREHPTAFQPTRAGPDDIRAARTVSEHLPPPLPDSDGGFVNGAGSPFAQPHVPLPTRHPSASIPPPLPPEAFEDEPDEEPAYGNGGGSWAPVQGGQMAPGFVDDPARQEEARLRDELANWTISQAEERARVFRDLQAKVDAEQLRRYELEEKERRLAEEAAMAERARQDELERAAALAKYEQERAAWEAAERVRVTAEATDAIQNAVNTQDAPTLRAALNAYGSILEEAPDPAAVADLQLARDYLAQLDAAAQAFANEYNEAVTELHALTYAEVEPMQAETTLERLQAVAQRAAAAGVPDDVMANAQTKANALHATVVELLHARTYAEETLLEAARATHTLGYAAAEPLRAALLHAQSLECQGDVVVQAAATLDALITGEQQRVDELNAASEELTEALGQGQRSVAAAAAAGDASRV